MDRLIKIIGASLLLMLVMTGCVQEAVVDKDIYPGKILEITKDELTELDTSGGAYQQRIQEADVKLLKGPYKGQTIKVINSVLLLRGHRASI